jgi:hypothetical protein
MKYPSALAAVLIAVTGPAAATEYLSNGGFETSFFSPWDLEDIPGTDSVVATDNDFLGLDYGAESGGWFVVGAASTTAPSSLSQTFPDTAGQQLTVSGWAIGDKTRPNGLGEIAYFFDNQQLGAPAVTGTWTQSTFHATATALDTLTIQFGDDGSFIGLDNFSVSSGLAVGRDVPELSTSAMSLIGFAGLGLLARTGGGGASSRQLETFGRRARSGLFGGRVFAAARVVFKRGTVDA